MCRKYIKKNPGFLIERQHIYFYTKRLINNLNHIFHGLRLINPYIDLPNGENSNKEKARNVLDILIGLKILFQHWVSFVKLLSEKIKKSSDAYISMQMCESVLSKLILYYATYHGKKLSSQNGLNPIFKFLSLNS